MKTRQQILAEKIQPMEQRGTAPAHRFYVVAYEELGVGTPHYLETREQLDAFVQRCVNDEVPFEVGHKFRGTLTDGNRQEA